jgi:hypothetical protein
VHRLQLGGGEELADSSLVTWPHIVTILPGIDHDLSIEDGDFHQEHGGFNV